MLDRQHSNINSFACQFNSGYEPGWVRKTGVKAASSHQRKNNSCRQSDGGGARIQWHEVGHASLCGGCASHALVNQIRKFKMFCEHL